MSFFYLGAILVSLFGLWTLDKRFKLALSVAPKSVLKVLTLPYLLLIGWDATGIAAGVFYRGSSSILSGTWLVTPNFPLEELFFLALLCYTCLLVVVAIGRRK